MNATLVLMACSEVKSFMPQAANRLYLGPMWQTLRTHRGALPWDDIVVLSAKYGLIGSQEHIVPYDRKLTVAEADVLIARGVHQRPGPHNNGRCPLDVIARPGRLADRLAQPYRTVISAGAGDYARVFRAWIAELQTAGIVVPDAEVRQVIGGIGQQRALLGTWLRNANQGGQ